MTDKRPDIVRLRSLLTELKNANATLVAVSKKQQPDAIREVYDSGHKIFGENYVQELVEKHEQLPRDIEWHFIGHLQSNKVKLIAPFVSLIQSVDSLKLLLDINKEAGKNNRIINCLLQVHIAEEESKFGFTPEESIALIQSPELARLNNICIQGLMGMATLTANADQIRNEFRILKNIYERLSKFESAEGGSKFEILSFGMTSDYRIALEEGSNMVRIGSAIFGERN